MASKRDQVIEGVRALVKTALDFDDVPRGEPKPERIKACGHAIIRDGDPGDPEMDLCPLTYNYQHRIPLELGTVDTQDATRIELFDTLVAKIGAAIEADRSLGGLCNWLDAEMPEPDDAEISGAVPVRWADIIIVAHYATSNPLT